ncbi:MULTISPECIES: Rieske 2Fe-2S domain-containing protein [Nostocales]|uniref:Rieske 2Fe-2S domain-containing protein n=1 Tax=Dolichospermum flos-aquae UHCC 0037 TaxID=2590026 RepID=A0ACC7S9T1_DOLFA|nr:MULTISPECIES: Rieske 2Fe-2S domain-containing protein [Nostocales]MBO1066970.1 Rieske 2Fe-2S domain-containing protein [Anabaena sp. 54]MTJ44252.1 Rieske 2Fe-2S domain-containing protein [Dolichospermum flos-aquae UHCC 0037]
MQTEFNFLQHWYPLIPTEDLESQKPKSMTLLGKRLVIWKPTQSKTYRVFLDQCPHRLAPLSEGRIEDKTGNLMCSYHGWEFNENGICQRVPQAENPEIIAKNKENFCVVSFPVRQQQELLWVWPDEKTAAIAENTPLPLSPQIDAEKGFVWSNYFRDLEYDWQTLVENVADPSHVPFAHHGVQGNREKAQPIPLNIVKSTMDLIEVDIARGLPTTITFEPPCRLEYAISLGNTGKKLGLVVYCIPVSPGKSRIVAQFPRNFAKTLHRIIPRWWNHINERHLVLDGDMIFLQQQEYYLQQKQLTQSWKTAYKLPTNADRLVIEFRNWFDKYCQSKLPWQEIGINGSEPTTINENRAEVLDRYKQHTQHCSSCRTAVKNLERLQIGLLAYFVIVISGVAVLPDDWRLQLGLPLIITALLGVEISAWLKFSFIPKFYFVDYIHAEK